MMNTKSKIILLLLVVTTIGCSVKRAAINKIDRKGEILKEYEIDGTTYIISKEASDIKKYRILSTSNIFEISARSELLYVFDTLTNQCYKYLDGRTAVEIECDNLKDDVNLKEYIN